MSTLEQKLETATRDAHAEIVAKRLLIQVVEKVREEPAESRLDRANSILHAAILEEICDWKDSLTKAVEKLANRAMAASLLDK